MHGFREHPSIKRVDDHYNQFSLYSYPVYSFTRLMPSACTKTIFILVPENFKSIRRHKNFTLPLNQVNTTN